MTHTLITKNTTACLLATIALLSLLMASQATAQNGGIEPADEVIVVAPYNPNIHPAQALPETPQIDSSHSQAIPMPYIHIAQAQLQAVPMQQIKAVKYKLPKASNIFHNYAKLGYGSHSTPYGELLLNKKLDKATIGLYAKHISSTGSTNQGTNASYAHTQAKAFAQWGQADWLSAIQLSYTGRMQHYYGFESADYPSYGSYMDDSLKQAYHDIGLAWKGRFANQNDGVWDITSAYHYFTNKTEGTAQHIDADITYEQTINTTKDDSQHWGVALQTATHITSLYNNKQTHGSYQLAPYYLWRFAQWDLQLGAKLMLSQDSSSHTNVAPLIQLQYHLPQAGMQLYVRADGDVQSNSLRSLSLSNPYISPSIGLRNTQLPLRLQMGAKGQLLEGELYYEAAISYTAYKDIPLFVSDTTSRYNNSFIPLYDDVNAIGTQLHIGYKQQHWELHGELEYTHYSPQNEAKAWHKPALALQTRLYYTWNKWRLGALLHSQSASYNYIAAQGEKQIDASLDINLSADYQINKQLSLFAQLNNILNNRYANYYNYKVQGFGAMGGLRFVF